MSVAVSLVHDDRLWPDNPGCPLYDPEEWRREVEAYLDERVVVPFRKEMTRFGRRRTTVLRRRHHGSKNYGSESGEYKGDHPRLKALRTTLDAEVVDETSCAPRRLVPGKLVVATRPSVEPHEDTEDVAVNPAAESPERTKRPRRRRRKRADSLVVVMHAPVPRRRRVFDPSLDDRRAAIRGELQKLEVQLLFKLTKRTRGPIEEQITGLRNQLRTLDATV